MFSAVIGDHVWLDKSRTRVFAETIMKTDNLFVCDSFTEGFFFHLSLLTAKVLRAGAFGAKPHDL